MRKKNKITANPLFGGSRHSSMAPMAALQPTASKTDNFVDGSLIGVLLGQIEGNFSTICERHTVSICI